MTLADSFVAYSFWVYAGKPYDIDGLQTYYFEKRLKKLLKKEQIDYYAFNQLKAKKAEILEKLKQNA